MKLYQAVQSHRYKCLNQLDDTICKTCVDDHFCDGDEDEDEETPSCLSHQVVNNMNKAYLAPLYHRDIEGNLLDMIKNREWNLLSNEMEDLDEPIDSLEIENELFLHIALNMEAPLFVISLITRCLESSVYQRDDQRRLPLHVAMSKMALPAVIIHLIKLNPSACTSKDEEGNTPLHICFNEYVLHAYKPSEINELIRAFISNSPESVAVEDVKSRCPVELAILSDAPLKSIFFMQASKRNYQEHLSSSSGDSSAISIRSRNLMNISSSKHTDRIGVTMLG